MHVLSKSVGPSKTSPKFFIKPLNRTIFTRTKAPMAHKTFSQEQYSIRYFSIKVSIRVGYSEKISLIGSVNCSTYFAILLRRNSFFFETNLMLLQRITFNSYSRDSAYMTVV
jgi:hypothetical protein